VKRYATLKKLLDRKPEDVAGSLRAMAAILQKTPERGRIHLRLVCDRPSDAWTVEIGAKAPKVSEGASGKPDVEILTREETWLRIADGALSPLEAFVTGHLRVRGDAEMAKRIVGHLACGEGEIDICK